MIRIQLGRRNVSVTQISYLRGLQYEREKVKLAFKGNQHTNDEDGGTNTHQPKTAERLAEEHGVNERTIREEYINRIEVLEKVKGLLLLPDIQLATTQQVADFYEVDKEVIKKVIARHKDELDSDGFVVWKAEDFRKDNMSLLKINNVQGGFIIEFSDGTRAKSSNKGTSLFPRRAILRVGMLLRDSEIAKEVRTQL